MLKYQLNINSVNSDLQKLDINMFNTIEASFVGDGKMMLVCYVNERGLIHENDNLVVVHEVSVPETSEEHKASRVENYVVDSVNEDNLTFSIIYDKYIDLDASFARTESFRQYNLDGSVEDIEYIIIYFATYHHFDNEKEYVTVYLSDNVTNATQQLIKMRGQVIDGHTIRFVKKDNLSAYKRIFYTDIEIDRNYSSMTYFKVLQENFVFNVDEDGNLPNTTFYLQKVLTNISIPLTNTFSTELFNSINVDGFVKRQIEQSLNKTAENEKDIYYPVSSGHDIIRRIKFNFHFRQRKRDTDNEIWAIDSNSSWNGVSINNDKTQIILPNEFFSYTLAENQSDLLSYLGFSDSDVKYRRNVLKKSFVRLLFYDSINPLKQRLLSYSTIFFDTGNLLNKYMRNISNDALGCGYLTCTKNEDSYVVTDELSGIRVNRELNVKSRLDEDKIEGCRLSSQMVVSDKFMSSNSSEGFYLYLWKDNVMEGIPGDLYMRVEFNHAKYGRVLPFIMPYETGGITTFENIVAECNVIENGKLINNGYSLDDFRKYSYIHLKYERSDDLGYIYYLDPMTYGDNAAVDGDSLILNLYEANVT